MLGELESSAAAAHIPESVMASVMSSNVTDLPGAADDADEAIHERALEASIFGDVDAVNVRLLAWEQAWSDSMRALSVHDTACRDIEVGGGVWPPDVSLVASETNICFVHWRSIESRQGRIVRVEGSECVYPCPANPKYKTACFREFDVVHPAIVVTFRRRTSTTVSDDILRLRDMWKVAIARKANADQCLESCFLCTDNSDAELETCACCLLTTHKQCVAKFSSDYGPRPIRRHLEFDSQGSAEPVGQAAASVPIVLSTSLCDMCASKLQVVG